MTRFRSSALQAQNGFVNKGTVSSRALRRNSSRPIFGWWKAAPVPAARMNRMPAKDDSMEFRNLRGRCALSLTPLGIALMDRGDIVAGSKSTRKSQAKPQGVIADNHAGPANATTRRSQSASDNAEQHCG